MIEFFLSGVCHQFPEHCLVFDGRPLPLCARCLGMFLAIVLGLSAMAVLEGRRSGFPSLKAAVPLGLGALIWLVDGSNSFLEALLGRGPLYTPGNVLRLLSGALLGLAISAVVYPLLQYVFWREARAEPVLATAGRLLGLYGAGAVAITLALGWKSAPWLLWALAGAACVALTLSLVNATVVLLALRRDGRAERLWSLAPYLGVGLLLSLGETGAIATLRWALLRG